MENSNREEIVRIETKIESIENNVSEVKDKVLNLSDNINNLVVALTKNAEQSLESKRQINELKNDVKILYKKIDENKTFLWKMAIAIVLISNTSTIGHVVTKILGL